MNKLVNLIVKKTGLPDVTAQTVVNLVLDFLKKKLPGLKRVEGWIVQARNLPRVVTY